MNSATRGVVTLAALIAAGVTGYSVGQARKLAGEPPAALTVRPGPADGPILYYRAPGGRPFYSLTPRKTDSGEDYVPVQVDEDPSITPAAATKTAPKDPKRILYYRNPMGLPDTSPVPKKDSMNMDYIPVYADEMDDSGAVKVSLGKVQRSGVQTELVGKRSLVRSLRVPGVVELDERRISVVSLRFDGYIESVGNVTTGTHVRKGEPLMTIYGQDVLNSGARLIIEEEPGWRPVEAGGSRTSVVRGVHTPVIGARRQLENLQVPAEFINEIVRSRRVPKSIVWPAPQDGLVLDRTAVTGMKAKAGDVLFRIADHSLVWVMAEVAEGELGALQPGQTVTARARAHPARIFKGTVGVIYPHLNKETRTGRVRIELPNPDLALLPDMYMDVEIATGSASPVLATTESAVIDSGTQQVVILDRGEGRFEPVAVKLGRRGDGYVEILEGVREGDRVVTAANFLIDAESNLKAALKGFTDPVKEARP